jgi:hypothetical protein
MSKTNPQSTEPGKPGFWLGANKDINGCVVTEFTPGTRRTAWILKKSVKNPGCYFLETWCEENGQLVRMTEPAVRFRAKTFENAKARFEKLVKPRHAHEIAEYQEAARKCNANSPFHDLSKSEQERWIDAWIQAHKSEWPNTFSLPKDENSEVKIKDAMTADLLAMGFKETASLEIFELAKRAKKRMRAADKLNAWIVQNWFHGKRFSELSPKDRALSAQQNGFSCSEKSLGMKLTRLGLTARSGCR